LPLPLLVLLPLLPPEQPSPAGRLVPPLLRAAAP
jgi:hypothetical protein